MKKSLILLSVLASCVAYGEVENAEIKLRETVVSATGFDENQNAQIKNITVVKKEDIRDKGYNNLEDVLRNTAGVNFITNTFGAFPDLRGQGSEEAAKRVQVLVDGIPMNVLDVSHPQLPINSIPVNSVERIEIVNGGGSILYGSGTAGGVINIITNRSQENKIQGRVYYENGSYASNKVGIDTGVKVTDNLLVDLGYEYQNSNGYRDKEEKKSNNFRGGLTYNITENQTLRIKASKYKQDYFDTNSLSLEEVKQNRKQAKLDDTTDGEIDRTEYSIGYDIKAMDNLKFSLLGYKQKTERLYEGHSFGKMTRRGMTVDTDIKSNSLFKDEKTGLNLKADYEYKNGEFILGYNYLDNDAVRKVDRNISIVLPGPMGTMKQKSNTLIKLGKESHSIFAINKHSVTEKLETVLGYRYENSKYKINRKNSTSSINETKSQDNHAYEMGLNYKYSDTGNIYVKYERGFRSPSPTELTDAENSVYKLNNIKEEKYDTYEIGVKDVIGNSYVSATAFFTRTSDEIFTDMIVHGKTWKTKNINETERKGIELFAEQYFDKFRINESLTYVDAEISKGEDKGNRIPYVSKVKATVGAVYNVNSQISLNADFNYYSAPRDAGNNKLHSYTTTDIGAVYKHESGVNLQAGIKNLFGKKYYLYESIVNDSYRVAPERRYYVGVSYNF